jgi:hypothetical protein
VKLFPDMAQAAPSAQPQPQQPQPQPQQQQEPEPKKKEEVVALYDYEATDEGELTFKQGDVITVLEKYENGWWSGELRSQAGVFPVNFTKPA